MRPRVPSWRRIRPCFARRATGSGGSGGPVRLGLSISLPPSPTGGPAGTTGCARRGVDMAHPCELERLPEVLLPDRAVDELGQGGLAATDQRVAVGEQE